MTATVTATGSDAGRCPWTRADDRPSPETRTDAAGRNVQSLQARGRSMREACLRTSSTRVRPRPSPGRRRSTDGD
jgi:hypothetical protein